jgi:hypothetical protein
MGDWPNAHSHACHHAPPAGEEVTEGVPPVVFHHLQRLTGAHGVYEHARFDQPRVTHGYTTDDNARVLVVLAPWPRQHSSESFRRAIHFVVSGQVPAGWHNRMSNRGSWMDERGSDDCHGRALWGLGTVIGSGVADEGAFAAFASGLDFRSSSLRATSFAALGAVRARHHLTAEVDRFLDRLSVGFAPPRPGRWMWPEPRLTYANARIPQAMIEVGAMTGASGLLADGLELLEWLTNTERSETHFSFTPVGGRGPGDVSPSFDQQPIEAWAMADACRSALHIDGSSEWQSAVVMAARWFIGLNDNGLLLYDLDTGAGFDGLHAVGKNQNRGSESTLSALGALTTWADSCRNRLDGGASSNFEASL